MTFNEIHISLFPIPGLISMLSEGESIETPLIKTFSVAPSERVYNSQLPAKHNATSRSGLDLHENAFVRLSFKKPWWTEIMVIRLIFRSLILKSITPLRYTSTESTCGRRNSFSPHPRCVIRSSIFSLMLLATGFFSADNNDIEEKSSTQNAETEIFLTTLATWKNFMSMFLKLNVFYQQMISKLPQKVTQMKII